MFKYVKFKRIKAPDTVLEFKLIGDTEGIEMFDFTGLESDDLGVVSLKSEDETKINSLIERQSAEINCETIEYEEFKNLVENSLQINTIREKVKAKIAKKYSAGDEIAMLKRSEDDPKRQAYEDYVACCVDEGKKLKAEFGY